MRRAPRGSRQLCWWRWRHWPAAEAEPPRRPLHRTRPAAREDPEARADRPVRPDAPGVRRQVRHDELQALRDAGTNFRRGVPRLHGLRDRDQPQRDRVRPAPEAHGMGRRGVSRHRATCSAAAPATMWVTGDLTLDQFGTLVDHEGYPKLADYLHAKFPGTKFITVGEKSYAVESATRADRATSPCVCPAASPTRPRRPAAPTSAASGGIRSARTCRRTSRSRSADASTSTRTRRTTTATATTPPAWMYPEDGNRFFPGHDTGAPGRRHLGGRRRHGDDGARELVGHVRHAGSDRQGRAHVGRLPRPAVARPARPTTRPTCASPRGTPTGSSGGCWTSCASWASWTTRWSCSRPTTAQPSASTSTARTSRTAATPTGTTATRVNDGLFNDPVPALAPLIATGNVQFSYQSTGIETWLMDHSKARKVQAAAIMADAARRDRQLLPAPATATRWPAPTR